MKKKIWFITLTFVLGIFVVPNVYADEAEKYPKVSSNTASDSLLEGSQPTVEGSETANVTVLVEWGKFQLLEQKTGAGVQNRPADYTWIGLKFEFPDGATDIKIQDQHDSSYTETFTEWFGFNVDDLQTAAAAKKNLEKKFKVTWQDKDSNEQTQTITLVVNTANITVMDTTKTKEAWNENIYLEKSEQVKVDYSVTIDDYPGFSYFFYLDKNTKLTEATLRAELEKNLPKEEYEILGFYADEDMTEAFDFSEDLSTNTSVYVKVATKEVATSEDKGPDTADTNIYGLLTIILVSGLGLGCVIRKRMN